MRDSDKVKTLYEDLSSFCSNLTKDPIERRNDPSKVEKRVSQLKNFETDFKEICDQSIFDKNVELSEYKVNIKKVLSNCKAILKSRIEALKIVVSQSQEMAEKFDLRTASTLLPLMDGKDTTTKQLIDSIEFYSSLLDDNGKKLLITYVQKTRLSASAKIRFGNSSYANVTELITDLKVNCLSKKSASFLSQKLNNAKQGSRSVSDFGRYIEEVVADLTIAQVANDKQFEEALQITNERLAICAFARGLNNDNLRTIVKSRNFKTLKETITCAIEEYTPENDQKVLHFRSNHKFSNQNGYYERSFNTNKFHKPTQSDNFQRQNGRNPKPPQYGNNKKNYNNNNNFNNNRNHNRSNNSREFHNSQGRRSNKVLLAIEGKDDSQSDIEPCNSAYENNGLTFFRDP